MLLVSAIATAIVVAHVCNAKNFAAHENNYMSHKWCCRSHAIHKDDEPYRLNFYTATDAIVLVGLVTAEAAAGLVEEVAERGANDRAAEVVQ